MATGRHTFAEWGRTLGLLGVLVVFGLLATGCSKRGANSSADEKLQLRVWRYNQTQDPFTELINEFVGKNTTVNLVYKKKNLDGYELSALKSIAARSGPDIWGIPDDWLGDHEGQVLALPDDYYFEDGKSSGPKPADQVKELYPEGIASQITGTDGNVYGVPMNVDSLRLYYNPEVMSAATSDYRKSLGDNADEDKYAPVRKLLGSAPKTWGDLVEQTKYVTQRSGNTIIRSTIALGTADNIPGAADILQLLIMQNGGKITSTDRRNALFHIPETTPAGISVRPGENALDFYTSFSNPSKPNYSWNPSMPQALDAFGQGKIAMVIAFADFGQQLKIKYPKLEFEVNPVPQISASPLQAPTNLIRFSVETVSKVADSQNAAFAFLKTYTNIDEASSIAREQNLWTPYMKKLKDIDDPIANQILTGKSVYKKDRTQFDAAFRQMIIDVSQNGLTNAKALDNGAETINVLLKDDDQ